MSPTTDQRLAERYDVVPSLYARKWYFCVPSGHTSTSGLVAAGRAAVRRHAQRMRPRRPASSRSRHLLPGIEQVLRIERALDPRVELRRLRSELPRQPLRLDG